MFTLSEPHYIIIVSEMTYYVSSGTLNSTNSHPTTSLH